MRKALFAIALLFSFCGTEAEGPRVSQGHTFTTRFISDGGSVTPHRAKFKVWGRDSLLMMSGGNKVMYYRGYRHPIGEEVGLQNVSWACDSINVKIGSVLYTKEAFAPQQSTSQVRTRFHIIRKGDTQNSLKAQWGVEVKNPKIGDTVWVK